MVCPSGVWGHNQYFYKNAIEISFEEEGGQAVVRQENSYYPYGLVMPGDSFPTQPNRNLYNGGSEWQNDYGDLPDYYRTYYRNYDAALGRFISTDPLAEASVALSPYHYAGNEPLLRNDPLGDRRQTTRTGELISPWWDDYFAGGGSGDFVRGDIIRQLWMSRRGGFWDRDGVSGYFRSDADAFLYGAYLMTKNNGWGRNGFAADYGTAAQVFNSLSTDQVSTRSGNYLYCRVLLHGWLGQSRGSQRVKRRVHDVLCRTGC